jgi:hypothetical protein
LQVIYNKLDETLALLDQSNIDTEDKSKLIAWMKATIREIQVYTLALAENRLSLEAKNK